MNEKLKVYFVTNKKPLSHNGRGSNERYKQEYRDEFNTKYSGLYVDLNLPTKDILKSSVYLIHRLRKGNIPDVDNLSKPIIDAFTGLIYVDDSQIIRRSASILKLDDFDIMSINATELPYEIYDSFVNYYNDSTTQHIVLLGVGSIDPIEIKVGEI